MNPNSFFARLWMRIVLFILPKRHKIKHQDFPRFGAKQSPQDKRDYTTRINAIIKQTQYGDYYSNRKDIEALQETNAQGYYNSCVINASTTAVEFLAKKYGVPHNLQISRMHGYNIARQLTYSTKPELQLKNVGVYIRDGWKALQQQPGITIEKLFPYNAHYFNKPLGKSWVWRFYPDFTYHFIKGSLLRTKKQIIKDVLTGKHTTNGQPTLVLFGIQIPETFSKLDPNKVYKPSSMTSDAHAMLITGWDDNRKAFEIYNSWGKNWGDNGFAWVDEEWILEKAFDISYAKIVQ